jgi:4-cresol dehydrogenase (hydroxylating)
MRDEAAIGAWNVAGAIYGSRETVAATRKAVRRALKGYRVMFLNDRTLRLAGALQRTLARFGLGRGLGGKLESVRPIYGLLQGTPTDEPMRGAGWRVRGPIAVNATDPLDCHAGLLWVAPVLPATGVDAGHVLRLVEPIYEKYGFEALVTFTLITERSLVCVTNISFDRREADEVTRARVCYQELTDRLMAEGYVSYRTGPAGMSKLDSGSSVFWDVTSRIKDALDPQGIISTGRYDPRAA